MNETTSASELRVAERARSDELLQASEVRYRRLFESAKDGILILDAESGEIVDVNPFLIALTGYSHEEFLGKHLWDLGPFKDIAASMASFAALQDNAYVRYDDLPLETRDGRKVHVEFVSNVYRVEGQNVIQCNIRDITERKRAVAALRDKEQLLSEAQRLGHIGSWFYDASGRTAWSDEMYRLFGVSPETFTPTAASLIGLLHPDDRPAMQAWMAACAAGEEPAELEYRVIVADGSVRFFRGRGESVHDGNRLSHMAGTVQDITKNKRAEEDHARLATAVEQADEAIVISDTQATILYVNPAFERTTGYTREEALGRNPRFLKSGKHDAEFYRRMWETLNRGEVWKGHLINNRKDGTFFEEDASISPVRDAAGKIVNFVAVKRDVTHEALLQDQLRQAQKMDAIGSLAGGVAHDFNNLLSVILSYTELVLEALPEGENKDDLLEVKKAGERAAALTRQLLAFSRKQVLQVVPLDLNEIAAGVERMLRRILGEDIDLVQVLAPDLGLTLADPGQIEQVIMNLVVNARDAMPAGGKLTIETANVEIDDEYAARRVAVTPGAYVRLTITDTGSGMDEQTRSRVFEPFFTTKEKGKGTGLGLSTVYGIVKQSGGNVWIYSELGQGTRFKIYLPRALSATAVPRHPQTVPRLSTGTETILLVEDEEALRKVAERALVAAGYRVVAAAGGEAALLACAQHPGEIDLLLTDVVMPLMSGRTLAQELARTRPTLKVLYMSGYTDDAIVHHGVLDAGTAFLGKPFSAAELTRKVREVLDTAGTS